MAPSFINLEREVEHNILQTTDALRMHHQNVLMAVRDAFLARTSLSDTGLRSWRTLPPQPNSLLVITPLTM